MAKGSKCIFRIDELQINTNNIYVTQCAFTLHWMGSNFTYFEWGGGQIPPPPLLNVSRGNFWGQMNWWPKKYARIDNFSLWKKFFLRGVPRKMYYHITQLFFLIRLFFPKYSKNIPKILFFKMSIFLKIRPGSKSKKVQ